MQVSSRPIWLIAPIALIIAVLGLLPPWGDFAAATVFLCLALISWQRPEFRQVSEPLWVLGTALAAALTQSPLWVLPALAIWAGGQSLPSAASPSRIGLTICLIGLSLVFMALIAEHNVNRLLWALPPHLAEAALLGELPGHHSAAAWNTAREAFLKGGSALMSIGAILGVCAQIRDTSFWTTTK